MNKTQSKWALSFTVAVSFLASMSGCAPVESEEGWSFEAAQIDNSRADAITNLSWSLAGGRSEEFHDGFSGRIHAVGSYRRVYSLSRVHNVGEVQRNYVGQEAVSVAISATQLILEVTAGKKTNVHIAPVRSDGTRLAFVVLQADLDKNRQWLPWTLESFGTTANDVFFFSELTVDRTDPAVTHCEAVGNTRSGEAVSSQSNVAFRAYTGDLCSKIMWYGSDVPVISTENTWILLYPVPLQTNGAIDGDYDYIFRSK